VYFSVNGALADQMKSADLLEVVDAYTLATLSDGSRFILHVNQALLEKSPKQSESLLQPHQVRANGNSVDDCATCQLVRTAI
jgi:hypothetical protein